MARPRKVRDPILEHAHQMEAAALVAAWQNAERAALEHARASIDAGCQPEAVAEWYGMSHSTLYRWMATLRSE